MIIKSLLNKAKIYFLIFKFSVLLSVVKTIMIIKCFINEIGTDCRIFSLSIFIIFISEIILTYMDPTAGFIIYIFLLIFYMAAAIFQYPSQQIYKSYLIMSFIPMIRIISICVPYSGVPDIICVLVICVSLIVSGGMLMKIAKLELSEIGLYPMRIRFYIAVMGIPLGVFGYFIGQRNIYTYESPGNLIWVFLILVSISITEEFLFRGILLNIIFKILGKNAAIYCTSLLYSILTISGKSIIYTVYVFLVSILLGKLFFIYKSLPSLSILHIFINITAYLICPLLME